MGLTLHKPEVKLSAYTDEQIDLLKRTVAGGGLSNDHFALFLARSKATGLDPFTNQISCQVRDTKRGPQLTIVTGIDGFRLIANRTGQRDGEEPPQWCGPDGKWVHLWTSNQPPYAARAVVHRKGCSRPFYGIAKFDAYKPQRKLWPSDWWAKAPDHMLAKCAEALALRKAFPAELSGLYTQEEGQSFQQPPAQQPPARAVGGTTISERRGVRHSVTTAEQVLDEPLPSVTTQSVDVDALLTTLSRKRTLEGCDAWLADSIDALRQLSAEDKKEVNEVYKAKRRAIKAASEEAAERAAIADDDAEYTEYIKRTASQ